MDNVIDNSLLLDLNEINLYSLIKKLDDNPIDIFCLFYIILNSKYLDYVPIENRNNIYKIFILKLEYLNIVNPSNELESNSFLGEYITCKFYSTLELTDDIKNKYLCSELLSSSVSYLYNIYLCSTLKDSNKEMILNIHFKNFLKEFIDKNLNGNIFQIDINKSIYIINESLV